MLAKMERLFAAENTIRRCRKKFFSEAFHEFILMYAAVVNDISYFDMLRETGVHGIVSDFIYEDMMDAK